MQQLGRAVLVLLLVIAPASSSFAQDRHAGVKAGLNFASLADDSTVDTGYGLRTGLAGGGFMVLRAKSRVALQIEALFVEKGGSRNLSDPAVALDIEGTLKFTYLDLPVLARIKGPHVGRAALHFLAGPVASLRFDANYEEGYVETGTFGVSVDIGDDVRRFDFGVALGAGADVGSRLVVDLSYSLGLRNVFKDDESPSVRNRGFLATAGFRIF